MLIWCGSQAGVLSWEPFLHPLKINAGAEQIWPPALSRPLPILLSLPYFQYLASFTLISLFPPWPVATCFSLSGRVSALLVDSFWSMVSLWLDLVDCPQCLSP